jgi:hypothetical protein
VPVLRGEQEREGGLDAADDGDDRVAAGHGERAAGEKVVLHVDDEKRGFQVSKIQQGSNGFQRAKLHTPVLPGQQRFCAAGRIPPLQTRTRRLS